MQTLFSQYQTYILAGAGFLSGWLFFALLGKLFRRKQNTNKVLLQLTDDLTEIYNQAQKEITEFCLKYREHTDSDYHRSIDEFDKLYQQKSDELLKAIEGIKKKQQDLLAQTEKKASELIESTQTFADQQKDHYQQKKENADKTEKKIIEEAQKEAERLVDQARSQAADILNGANEEYKKFLEDTKQQVVEHLEKGHDRLLENIKDDEIKIIEQSQNLIKDTQTEAWKQVEKFNGKLLDEFNNVYDRIIQQSEERAQVIGNKVLRQIEDNIVAYIIGIVHETIELTLTPEQHQGLIIKAIQNMKRQIDLGQIQKIATSAEDLSGKNLDEDNPEAGSDMTGIETAARSKESGETDTNQEQIQITEQAEPNEEIASKQTDSAAQPEPSELVKPTDTGLEIEQAPQEDDSEKSNKDVDEEIMPADIIQPSDTVQAEAEPQEEPVPTVSKLAETEQPSSDAEEESTKQHVLPEPALDEQKETVTVNVPASVIEHELKITLPPDVLEHDTKTDDMDKEEAAVQIKQAPDQKTGSSPSEAKVDTTGSIPMQEGEAVQLLKEEDVIGPISLEIQPATEADSQA